MASNGLVANETKTVFMILNMNSQEKLKKEFEHIQIGKDLVKRSDSTKLPTKNWKDVAKLKCAQESFTIDTARLWNRAPLAITNATSLQTAKNCIKRHCKEMPI